MRRIVIYGLAALVLGAAGWSALWLSGRGEITARIGLERDRLAAEGFEIAHGAPAISGFPFGYDVSLPDVVLRLPVEGLRADLAQITASTGLGAPDRIVYRLPTRFTVQSEGEAPGLVEIEADGLVIEQTLESGRPARLGLRAASVLAVHAAEGQALNAAVEFAGIEASLEPPQAAVGETTLRLAVDSIDYLVTGESDAGAATRLEGGIARLGLTAATDQRGPASVLAVLAGAPGGGRLALTLQAGEIRVAGGVEAAGGGTTTLAIGAVGGVMTIADGRVALSGSTEHNRLEIAPNDADATLRGGAVIDRIETVYRSPLVPAERMDELALRVALGKITPDDAFWAAVDPAGVLSRTPGEIILDLVGTARMLADEATGAPREAELGTLSVRTVDVAMLGAQAELTGDLEFLQPANQPVGRLVLTLTRAMEVLGDLARAGILDLATVQIISDTAANYTRAGEAPQTLVSEFAFDGGEVTLNGNRLWMFGGGR